MITKAIQATASLLILSAFSSGVFAQDKPDAAGDFAANAVTSPMRQLFVACHFNRASNKNRQPQWDPDVVMPQIKAMGAQGVRDGTSWAAVEKVKGQYVLPEADRKWVEKATAAGFKIIFLLSYGNKLYENELDPDAFANYSAFMAKTFKDNPSVIAFEIWNEPGNFFFRKQFGGQWNGIGEAPWLEKFAGLVEKSSAAIHRVNPNVKVIAGAGVAPPMAYLIDRYPEAFKSVDGLVEHPYSYRTPPETIPFGGPKNLERDGIAVADEKHSMESLLKGESDRIERKTGRRLPVWVTEFGFGTHTRQKKSVLYNGYTEAAQAAYHSRALIQGLAYGAAIWAVYDFVDDGLDASDPEHNFGLTRYTGNTPKPAYFAIQRVAKLLGPDWKSLGSDVADIKVDFDPKITAEKDSWASPNPDPTVITGPMLFTYKVPAGYVTFVWNAGRVNTEQNPPVGTLTLDAPENVASADMINVVTGKASPLKLTTGGGKSTVTAVPVGGEPVAVKWTVK